LLSLVWPRLRRCACDEVVDESFAAGYRHEPLAVRCTRGAARPGDGRTGHDRGGVQPKKSGVPREEETRRENTTRREKWRERSPTAVHPTSKGASCGSITGLGRPVRASPCRGCSTGTTPSYGGSTASTSGGATRWSSLLPGTTPASHQTAVLVLQRSGDIPPNSGRGVGHQPAGHRQPRAFAASRLGSRCRRHRADGGGRRSGSAPGIGLARASS